MKTTLLNLRRAGVAAGLAALVAGGAHAVWGVLSRPWVREFQAGARSPTGERLLAIAQQTAIEVLGFAVLAVLLGAFATALTSLRRRARGHERAGELAASFVLAVGAFVAWVTVGTWFAEAALPFLRPSALVLLNLGGFVFALAGFFLFDALARRVPRDPARFFDVPWSLGMPAARALASAACAGVALSVSLRVLTRGSGGWRDPLRLLEAAGVFLVAVGVAPFLGRLVARPVDRVVRRLAAGPVLPRPARLALGLLVVVCVAGAAPTFRLSAIEGRASYRDLVTRGAPPGPNVLVVTIDTLRADHLGCYGYERPTSPVIDALAAEGARCADPVSAAAWTKPATGTILTGLYPSRHGALYHGSRLQLPPGERTLAEAFRDAGYVTAGFVSNPNLKRVFDFDRGFDEYFDSPVEDTITLASIRASWFGQVLMRLMRHQFNWKYENDVRQMNRHVFAWLDENAGKPFFLYVHYIDPHIPYSPPEPWRSEFERDHGLALFNERKEQVGIDLYDGEIRYVDTGLGELFDELRRHGLWDDLLVVVTSDHGEEFFEHGVLGHGFSIFQPVVGVPLVFRGPGVPAETVVEEPVQVLDMPATLLELAGTGVDALGDGRSFAPLLRGAGPGEPRALYVESEFGQNEDDRRSFVFTGVREGRWKLVLTEENLYFPPDDPAHGGEALYDLEADPGEEHNLFHDPARRALVERLLAELVEHRRFLEETGFRDADAPAMDPGTVEELRALGYL